MSCSAHQLAFESHGYGAGSGDAQKDRGALRASRRLGDFRRGVQRYHLRARKLSSARAARRHHQLVLKNVCDVRVAGRLRVLAKQRACRARYRDEDAHRHEYLHRGANDGACGALQPTLVHRSQLGDVEGAPRPYVRRDARAWARTLETGGRILRTAEVQRLGARCERPLPQLSGHHVRRRMVWRAESHSFQLRTRCVEDPGRPAQAKRVSRQGARFVLTMIGVFDSGVGGLTVLKAMRDAYPSIDVVYFGDTKNAPYGLRSREELSRLTVAGIGFLLEHGASAIVSACNSVSASLVLSLYEVLPLSNVPLIEMVGPCVNAFKGTNARVALCATTATVESGMYQNAFHMIGKDIITVAIPELAGAIEKGEGAEAYERYIRAAFAQVPADSYDILILGCTHYPQIG